jgi:hypothetical protein
MRSNCWVQSDRIKWKKTKYKLFMWGRDSAIHPQHGRDENWGLKMTEWAGQVEAGKRTGAMQVLAQGTVAELRWAQRVRSGCFEP